MSIPNDESNWHFSNGPEFPGAEGALSVESGVLKLDFDFTGGGNYVQAGADIPKNSPGGQIRFRVKKEVPNLLSVRVTDSSGQTFQKNFQTYTPDWQNVSVALNGIDRSWGYWGGKSDGVFHSPAAKLAILVNNGGRLKGAVLIDDVNLHSDVSPRTGYSTVEYSLDDFKNGWQLLTYGSPGNTAWSNGKIKIDFSKGGTSLGIRGDVSFLGKPEFLKLKVDAPKGWRLTVHIGSHFESFERGVQLSSDGVQTIEFPMGDMKGWTHYGSETDGVPQYPLRLTRIFLDKLEGPESGTVKLLEARASVTLSPSERIALIPDVSRSSEHREFSCEIRNLYGKPITGTITTTIRDWQGNVLFSKSAYQRVESDRATYRISPALARVSDKPFLECEFTFRFDRDVYGPVTVCYVNGTAGLPAPDKSLQPQSPFGMGVYLYRVPVDQMDKLAKHASAAGVKWSREEFQWTRIEPEKGKFNFEFYDALVESAKREGISIYGLIAHWATWTKPFTQEGIDDYANMCKALVNRYKDFIKHWEIWNEPNIFFWDGPKEMYPELLKAAYKAIKEADPEARVLGCSTAGIDTRFIKMVMDADAPFDILTIHPYRQFLEDEVFIKELQDVHKLACEKDGRPKPVWITEMGWHTALLPGGVSERQQAGLLARTYLSSVGSGVPTNVSWYNFRDDGENPHYWEMRFGANRHDFAPKPAYRALASVCSRLQGLPEIRRINIGDGILAFVFKGEKTENIVLWTSKIDRIITLKYAKELVFHNLMGEKLTPLNAEGAYLLTLQADEPVFIEGAVPETNISEVFSLDSRQVSIDVPDTVSPGQEISLSILGLKQFMEVWPSVSLPRRWKIQAENRPGKYTYKVSVPPKLPEGEYSLKITLKYRENQSTIHRSVRVLPELIEL